MTDFELEGWLSGSAGKRCGFTEFTDDRAGVLSALATFARYPQLGPDLGQLGVAIAAGLADLLIGNLTANANVHIFNLFNLPGSLNLNENDCQQHLYLILCILDFTSVDRIPAAVRFRQTYTSASATKSSTFHDQNYSCPSLYR